jgi:hypothetical protein
VSTTSMSGDSTHPCPKCTFRPGASTRIPAGFRMRGLTSLWTVSRLIFKSGRGDHVSKLGERLIAPQGGEKEIPLVPG